MSGPSRRRVLGTVGAASTALLAGCAVQDAVLGEDVPGGHLYVRNTRGNDERVSITVEDTSTDGELVIDAVYRVPPEHVLAFEEVLASGHTYEFVVSQPDVPEPGEERLSVTAETCDEGDPAEKLDVLVLVTAHGPDFTTYDCDRVYSRNDEYTYVEPSEYWITSDTDSTATPTPDE